MTEDGPKQPALDHEKQADPANLANLANAAHPENARDRWRTESRALRAVYQERTGLPLPPAAVPLPRPARRVLSLLLLAMTTFVFVLCAAASLVVLQPNASPPADVPRQVTPIFPHATATNGNTIILPGVTFTTQTPAIVEPVGGGKGLPYVTPTATGGPAVTATPSGTPGGIPGGVATPPGPPVQAP